MTGLEDPRERQIATLANDAPIVGIVGVNKHIPCISEAVGPGPISGQTQVLAA